VPLVKWFDSAQNPYDQRALPVSAELSELRGVRIRHTRGMQSGRRRVIAGGRSVADLAM